MYVCRICHSAVGPRVTRRKYTIYRPDGTIAREYPVCPECMDDLDAGISLDIMLEEHRITVDHVGRPLAHPPSLVNRPVVPTSVARAQARVTHARSAGRTPTRQANHCDLCGEPATGGQVTARTTLCRKHADQAREGARDGTRPTTAPERNGKEPVSRQQGKK